MAFLPEPVFEHGSRERTAVLLINLGTPDEASTPAVRRYLRQFLSDPRVVEIPRLPWRVLLETVILPFRPKQSAIKYQKVWTKDGSPLMVHTAKQAKLLRGRLGQQGVDVLVDFAMRYGSPSIESVLSKLKAEGATRILILPLYPQYSATTTATSQDAISSWCKKVRNVPELRFVRHYHDHPAYIAALAHRFRTLAHPEKRDDPLEGFAERFTVFSFHGLPQRNLRLGDPYHCECLKTGRLLAEALNLRPDQYRVTFQSRFGKAAWLEPYTEPTLVDLAKRGVRAVDVFCPGFPADCLETLEEISIEARAAFIAAGGRDFHYIAALNEDPPWIDALAAIALQHMGGWALDAQSADELEAQKNRAVAHGATPSGVRR